MAEFSHENLEALFGSPGREDVSRVVRPGDALLADGGLGTVCCAIGVFDGVHEGHRKLVSDCISAAHARGVPSAIVTFDPDPEELFSKRHPRKLMSNGDRIRALARLGADYVFVQSFDQRFSHLQPGEFLEELLESMAPADVFVGNNFRFGHMALGDLEELRRILGGSGCDVEGEELLCEDGEPVTATRIRDLVENGRIEEANKMLGRPFFIQAEVVAGRQVGRTIGYPTANLVPCHPYANLGGGVYTGYVLVHGEWFKAPISVGVPKTFGDLAPTMEAHLIDFDEDIYGEVVTVCFTRYLRQMKKFDSIQDLVDAIAWYTESAMEQPADPGLSF